MLEMILQLFDMYTMTWRKELYVTILNMPQCENKIEGYIVVRIVTGYKIAKWSLMWGIVRSCISVSEIKRQIIIQTGRDCK